MNSDGSSDESVAAGDGADEGVLLRGRKGVRLALTLGDEVSPYETIRHLKLSSLQTSLHVLRPVMGSAAALEPVGVLAEASLVGGRTLTLTLALTLTRSECSPRSLWWVGFALCRSARR